MFPIRKMISNGYDAGEGAEIGSVWPAWPPSAAIAVGGMESELVPTEPGQTDPISAPTCNHIRKEDDSRNRIRTTSWSSFIKLNILDIMLSFLFPLPVSL